MILLKKKKKITKYEKLTWICSLVFKLYYGGY